MIRDEILAKEPGRDLDAVVAEEMGISSFTTHDFFGNPHLSYFDDAPDGERSLYNVPHYSTEISAAWPLVEEMVSAGCEVNIFNKPDGTVEIEVMEGEDSVVWTQVQNTAPEAICKAYLLWRESEND